MSPAAWLFVGLLAIELPLLAIGLSTRTRLRAPARLLLFLVPLVTALAFRGVNAFSTHEVLDWDETYYTSMAVTAAAGRGLYPYIYGFPPIPIMGGTGYAAYSDALAVRVFGPTVFAVRSVSLLAAICALAAMWMLLKQWYGAAAAWIGAALTASLQLFVMANTARMDSWTFAWATAALAVTAAAFARWPRLRWHAAAGFVCALGLQAHIDTAVTTAACGVLYAVRYLADARSARRGWLPRHPLFAFAGGALAGVAVYVCANILPDPVSYYVMTVRVRLDATHWYSGGTSSIFGSFLDPRILFAKEGERYRLLAAAVPALEMALAAAGLAAAALRRSAADRLVLWLVPATLLGAAILLNNASPYYFIHVLPALAVPIAPLFTHGLRRHLPVPLPDVAPAGLAAAVLVVCAVCASSSGRTIRAMEARRMAPARPVVDIASVRALVDRRCRIAGDADYYVPHFADYPFFISFRKTEVSVAMLYFGSIEESEYWRIKQPDVVFAPRGVPPALTEYLAAHSLTNVAPGLWMNPAGCRPGP